MTNPSPTITGSWTTSGALTVAGRWDGQHDTAVLLADGDILVAGGADAAGAALARAERFDPATGHWTSAGNLRTPRRLHSVTRLADGRVLVAGGTSVANQFPAPALAAAEVYDPQTGEWKVTGPMRTARWGHSAVPLSDGSVLVAGGSTVRSGQSITALRSAERYDPGSGEWTEVAAMTDARSGHPAVVPSTGQVLVVGGSLPVSRSGEAALGFCELYDAEADRWTPTGSLLAPRSHHQATVIPGDADPKVLVTGGSPPGAGGDGTFDPFSRSTAEVFDPATGTWTAVDPMPGGRGHHRAIALGPDRVLVVGGADSLRNDAGFASALVYDAVAQRWEPTAGLAEGRWAFVAVALADHRILVTGGIARTGLAASGPAASTVDSVELTATTEIFAVETTP